MNINNTTDFGTVKILMLKGEKGEAGVSGDYSGLANKPQINGHVLSGNMLSSDLGLESAGAVEVIESELRDDLISKNDVVVFTKSKTFSAESSGMLSVSPAELLAVGVDDIANYEIISFSHDQGDTNWIYGTDTIHSENPYPYIQRFINNTNEALRMHYYNGAISSVTVQFRVVLLRVVYND